MHLANQYPLVLCKGKKPIGTNWGNKRCTPEQVEGRGNKNVGLVLGPKSGVIDIECDTPKAVDDFAKLFEGCNVPTTPTYNSPKGPHRLFKWDTRLAPIGKAVLKYGDLEIRLGAGDKAAQSLIPPSTGRTWETSLDDVDPAPLPDMVIERLIAACGPKPKEDTDAFGELTKSAGGRPGDDFNKRGKWADILKGWTVEGTDHEGKTLWKRPGKTEDGHSATTGHCTDGGKDRLYVFSTNAVPFEGGKAYDKFAAFAMLNHSGDFTKASEALATDGYGDKPKSGGKQSAADKLVDIGMGDELFHTPERTPHATATIKEHAETWPVHSTGYGHLLTHRYWESHKKAPTSAARSEALAAIAASAVIEGKEKPVFVRVASHDNAVYLDLCNDRWQVVEITSDGWQVVDRSPVKFQRSPGMLSLPTPVNGGSISELRKFVNVSDDQWPLVIGALVAAFNPDGKFPVTVLFGEQGSAKTTTAQVFRSLIDPNEAAVRVEPKTVQDLVLAALNSWLLTYDNLSKLPTWLSDALCRMSTGGGFATRRLYTDTEETIINVERPTLLTGIDNVVISGDLLDRCLLIELPVIKPGNRRTSGALWADFEADRARILGALLTQVSGALRERSNVSLQLPRMADAAQWIVASENAGGWGLPENSFVGAYTSNQEAAVEQVLDAPVPNAIRQFMASQATWEGTAGNLLDALQLHCHEVVDKAGRRWPTTPRALSSKIARFKPHLRKVGIEFDKPPRTNGKRGLVVTNRNR